MLKLLHYSLADPANLPTFPSEWGLPPALSSAERQHIPYGLASMLWSDVGLTFYEKCTIGKDLPGWVMKEEQNQEVLWKILPPKENKEWDWLYEADLLEDTSILETVRDAALERLHKEADPKRETAYLTDPSTAWLLAHVATRCHDIRPVDWDIPRDREPVGFRLKAKEQGAKDAVVITGWSEQMIGPRAFLIHSANLTPDLIPDALEAIDVIGHGAKRKEAWAFGPAADDDFTSVVKGLPHREVRQGRRAEIDGHLLAVAWYGDQEERGRFLDLDILGWC